MMVVGISGALGAISRFLLGNWIASKSSTDFPFGTFVINIIGSFLLGIVFTHFKDVTTVYSIAAIGFLGSFTTFSTFSFEAIQLYLIGERKKSILYVVLSVITCVIFTRFGMLI